MNNKKLGRPKSTVQRKTINTKIALDVIDILKETSEKTGIPQNRLIEDAIKEKYDSNQGENK